MSDNHVLKTYWEGPLSNLEILSIKSFIANGHTILVYTYDKKMKSFDKSMEVKDASEILPIEKRYQVKGMSTIFSDVFRYYLLYKDGGVWVDLDLVLLKPITTDNPIVMSYAFKKKENGGMLNLALNSVPLKVPKGHALVEAFLKNVESKDLGNQNHAYLAGPLMIIEVSKLNLCHYIVSPEIYSPLGWWEAPWTIHPGFGFDRIQPVTVAIHLFNTSWSHGENTNKPIDKNGKYHPESLYEALKKKYGVL